MSVARNVCLRVCEATTASASDAAIRPRALPRTRSSCAQAWRGEGGGVGGEGEERRTKKAYNRAVPTTWGAGFVGAPWGRRGGAVEAPLGFDRCAPSGPSTPIAARGARRWAGTRGQFSLGRTPRRSWWRRASRPWWSMPLQRPRARRRWRRRSCCRWHRRQRRRRRCSPRAPPLAARRRRPAAPCERWPPRPPERPPTRRRRRSQRRAVGRSGRRRPQRPTQRPKNRPARPPPYRCRSRCRFRCRRRRRRWRRRWRRGWRG